MEKEIGGDIMTWEETWKLKSDKIPMIGHPHDTEKLIQRVKSYCVHHKGKLVWKRE